MSKGDKKEIATLISDFQREIRAEIRSLKESLKFCCDTCDEVKKIGTDIRALRAEVKELVSQNEKLKAENHRLEKKVEELEQYQRSNNLEIKGAPEELDSTIVVKKIGELVGEPISDSDIDICHRVSTAKRNERNIVVRLISRNKRNAVLAKAKKQRILSSHLDYEGAESVIYVNEHLTRQNKQLLGAAIAKKKSAKWKFVWSSGGKILARKDETSDVIRITSPIDLGLIK